MSAPLGRTTLTARWVLPIDAPPIPDGAVVVAEDRIVWVGPAADAPATAHVEPLGDVVLLPGLVNAHSHLELTAWRGLLEALDFRAWIRTLTASSALLTDDELLASSIVGACEALAAGVTTCADTSPSGIPLRAMQQLGLRGIVYREVFGPDPARAEEALQGLRAEVDRLRATESSRVRVGISPHAPYSVSAALFRATAAFARETALPVAVHIAESEAESQLVTAATGRWADLLRERGLAVDPAARSPIALLEDTGILAERPLLIHCVRIDARDRQAIAAHGATIVHCPVSNAKLGHGIAPLAECLAGDVTVGLGTDSVAANNQMDLLGEARTAVLMQRARLGRPDTISARDALHLATLGGARAIGLEDRIGSITPGKQADLTAFPLDDWRATPVVSPADALVFAMPGVRARHVWVDGIRRVRDGAVLDVPDGVVGRTQAAAARLARWRRDGADT